MTSEASSDQAKCSYWGGPAADGWLGIEAWRDDGGSSKDMRVDIQDLGFCQEEDVGRFFLEGMLPAPDFSEPEALPRTSRDRLFDAFVLALLVLAAGFIGLGVWTAVQWIRS